MPRPSRWLAWCLPLAACGACDGDAPGDAFVPVDIDNGMCGAQVRFTGEYVDWDETPTKFCGVFGARFAARGGGAMGSTAPNGRFDLCIPDQAVTLLDITPPTQPSQCTVPQGTYAMPAIAVASKDVIFAGGFWSGRAFTMGRQAFDPAKAQVFVHIHGAPRAVTLGAAHGPAQAHGDAGWASGDTGQDVFFPDVDPAGGQTTVSAPGAIAPASIPLVAGTMTNVSIVVR